MTPNDHNGLRRLIRLEDRIAEMEKHREEIEWRMQIMGMEHASVMLTLSEDEKKMYHLWKKNKNLCNKKECW